MGQRLSVIQMLTMLSYKGTNGSKFSCTELKMCVSSGHEVEKVGWGGNIEEGRI